MRLGDLSVSYVELMASTVESLGYPSQPILQQFKLDSERITSPEARISIPRFMRLGHAFIQAYEIPWLGLAMGKRTSAAHLGLAGLLAYSATNVQQACQMLVHYEGLGSFNSRGHSVFNAKQGCLQFYSISPYNQYNYFVVDSVLAGWSHVLKSLHNDSFIRHLEVEFSAPAYQDEYFQHLGCEVRFSSERNALLLRTEHLGAAVKSACSTTHALLKNIADQELLKVRYGLSISEQTERAISPLLNGQTPTLEQVAQRLNRTPWSLRRALEKEGATFQAILNNTRKDLAISYVRDTTLSLGEISYILGGLEPATPGVTGRYSNRLNYRCT